ncbi:MAG: serine hydrolase domain-containing protein, partial [Flavobacteriaceae bacterium]
MKKQLLIAFLAFGAIASGQKLVLENPENLGISSERLARISDTFDEYVAKQQLPGGVILVARNGKIAYHQAFGKSDRENNQAMTTDHIFRIASQTKALVSVGIMILQEEGRLLISDPLSKYIPEFKNTTVALADDQNGYTVEKANREITLRDLLTHTAGIGYGYGLAADQWAAADIQGWYFAHRDVPVLETIKKMASLPNEAQPGEKFVYGYNTDILGAVIEMVSGQTLNAFLQQKILTPLGMKDTHFYLPPSKAQRLAVVYNQENGQLKRAPDKGTMNAQGHYLNGPRVSFSGGAGLLSTATDYAIFLQMLLNGGSYDGQRILSRKSVELMTVNHLNFPYPWSPGTGFGLGFSITTDLGLSGAPGSVGAFGWGGAYHSVYWADPQEDLLVVYCTQVIPSTLDDLSKLRALGSHALV